MVVYQLKGSPSLRILLANWLEPDDKEREKSKTEGIIGQGLPKARSTMSLKPQAICPVPPETVRVARAAYPKGNIYLHLRDTLGRIYTDEDFADLYPKDGQPAEAPWRLALVSVMQCAERTFLIGKPPMQSVGDWTGSICLA